MAGSSSDRTLNDIQDLNSPLSFDRFPSDILHLLYLAFDDLPQSALRNLIQCSWEMHDRFAPILYDYINMDKRNTRSLLAGLEPLNKRKGRNKLDLLAHTRHLTITDLPAAEHLSRALTKLSPTLPSRSPPSSASPSTSTSTSVRRLAPHTPTAPFSALYTLHLTGKAIMGLADIYNASSWGSSSSNIASQPILRALRHHIRPQEVVLDYPDCILSVHMHSCVEEVIAHLCEGWDLDRLVWKNLQRALIGPVPRARKSGYHFKPCNLLPRGGQTHTLETIVTVEHSHDQAPGQGHGCSYHYDQMILTYSAFIEHLQRVPCGGDIPKGDENDTGIGIGLEMRGLRCISVGEWRSVVETVYHRMGKSKADDKGAIAQWNHARVSLVADD
ncbi:uncharacterized protein I303_102301 [Kwoniella dejecticola CBS 10117]|uniref:Uncharacterized protein n=1 Tax=Kwoniella dejecticola CBS 10117 TaxID=1296121 RepID=A0A1A6ABC3_9TREE|nr:uncharacterized protein I303_01559 [Kwoniella dejecticola CBS 10117]OBR87357.1 hypothetical protein I303_01559 [Kwoniella dejecticola CBS 10117]